MTRYSRHVHVLTGLAAVLAGALGLAARPAEACEVMDRGRPDAPNVIDAGFEVVGPAPDGSSTGFLWVKLSPPPEAAGDLEYVAEGVWGDIPGLERLWGWTSRTSGSGPIIWSGGFALSSAEELEFGFQIRAIDRDGRNSLPSETIPISHPGAAAVSIPPRSDQLLFLILIAGFIGIWCWYRRETDRIYKIRVAAAAALASVLFLSVTPAMPWLAAEDPQSGEPAAECLLGDEARCASYAAAPERMTMREASRRTFELQRWECASAAVQIGQVMSLIMLLPVLIWLIVAPRSRAAQAALTVGASVAAFTLLSVFFFRQAIPSWMPAEVYWTLDIAMMTTANLVLAAALVAKHAFAMACPARLPTATARHRRRR